ncbi:hypothetical protein HZS_1142 [Henneguya salminicola]|nr:hypothetical protein HZS_1142 [Henneguya salminicola]
MALHGQKKEILNIDQQIERKRQETERQLRFNQFIHKLITMNKKTEFEMTDLLWSNSILIENPEITHIWNFRKRVLSYLNSTFSNEKFDHLCEQELELISQCINHDSKAYCVWNHRIYVFNIKPTRNFEIEHEHICRILMKEPRNFHCWNYLRHFLHIFPNKWDKELIFTKKMIDIDFSNFSAWHHRTIVISKSFSQLLDDEIFIDKELKMLHNAVYTDPWDQSPWIYYAWLLSHPSSSNKSKIICASSHVLDSKRLILLTIKFASINIEDKIAIKNKSKYLECHWDIYDFNNTFSLLSCVLDTFPPLLEIDLHGDSVFLDCIRLVFIILVQCQFSYQFDFDCYSLGSFSRPLYVLQSELIVLSDLLDLEPNNRRIILNLVNIMISIDIIGYQERAINLIDRLISIDNIRSGYYINLSFPSLYHSLEAKIKEISFLCSLSSKQCEPIETETARLCDIVSYPEIFVHLKTLIKLKLDLATHSSLCSKQLNSFNKLFDF